MIKKNKRLTETFQAVMTVFILYINFLNLSWIIKCLFLRNIEPFKVKKIQQMAFQNIFSRKHALTFHARDNLHEMSKPVF